MALVSLGLVLFFVLIYVVVDETNKKRIGKKVRPRSQSIRIDHPHYFEEDDHECSVCGTRFRGKRMTCPKCGTKFTGTREDDGEFVEEMVIWDDEDDD